MLKVPANPPTHRYTCTDYREEMRLMALKRELENKALSAAKIKIIKDEIEQLEKAMGMD